MKLVDSLKTKESVKNIVVCDLGWVIQSIIRGGGVELDDRWSYDIEGGGNTGGEGEGAAVQGFKNQKQKKQQVGERSEPTSTAKLTRSIGAAVRGGRHHLLRRHDRQNCGNKIGQSGGGAEHNLKCVHQGRAGRSVGTTEGADHGEGQETATNLRESCSGGVARKK